MTKYEVDIVTAQADSTEVSADELAGQEVEPEHDADPSTFHDESDDERDEDDEAGGEG